MPTLDWHDKDKDVKASKEVRFRLLTEVSEYSYGDKNTGNMIVHGDNLEALKALLPYYKGRVKCIYIDPPYNTGRAYKEYDDNLEHSIWLKLMYPRLELLGEFLSESGVILVEIDDIEMAYLKVIMDEIFGRNKFVCSISIKSNSISGNKTANKEKTILKNKDYILVYKKSDFLKIKPQYTKKDKWDTHYTHYLKFGDTKIEDFSLKEILIKNNILKKGDKITARSIENQQFYDFVFKNANNIFQLVGSITDEQKKISLNNPDKITSWESDGKIFYALNGRRFSPLSSTINEVNGILDFSQLLGDLWIDIDFQNTQNEGGVSFPANKKPESLIKRIIDMFTSPNDIVMDSFLGSGTTAAVAQKMGRKYIGIELGDHAYTHIVPRMKNVLNGDQSGISNVVKWKGGGGYKFYELAEAIYDDKGNLNKEINANELGAFIWYKETQTSIGDNVKLPFLGILNGVSYYLMYDSKKDTCLDITSYKDLKTSKGKKVIYADLCKLGSKKLADEQIEFRQIPYDITKLGR